MASNEELAVSMARVEEQVKAAVCRQKTMMEKIDKLTDDHEYRLRDLENASWKNRVALIVLATLGGGAGAWVSKFLGIPLPPPGVG